MHACGHDFHMSIALGVLTHFVHEPIQDDIVFIFQPAEEAPGGAEPAENKCYERMVARYDHGLTYCS